MLVYNLKKNILNILKNKREIINSILNNDKLNGSKVDEKSIKKFLI